MRRLFDLTKSVGLVVKVAKTSVEGKFLHISLHVDVGTQQPVRFP